MNAHVAQRPDVAASFVADLLTTYADGSPDSEYVGMIGAKAQRDLAAEWLVSEGWTPDEAYAAVRGADSGTYPLWNEGDPNGRSFRWQMLRAYKASQVAAREALHARRHLHPQPMARAAVAHARHAHEVRQRREVLRVEGDREANARKFTPARRADLTDPWGFEDMQFAPFCPQCRGECVDWRHAADAAGEGE